MKTKITLEELNQINHWQVTTDDGCDGWKTPWIFYGQGSVQEVLAKIVNDKTKVGWGFTFEPLKISSYIDLTEIINCRGIKLEHPQEYIEIPNCPYRFEFSFWYESGIADDELIYYYVTKLLPDFKYYLKFTEWWETSTGKLFTSPIRRPGTVEYKMQCAIEKNKKENL